MLVWESTVDNGTYDCHVERLSDYRGNLSIWRDGSKIFEQEVGLAYAARFGPDCADVADWQEICMNVIDKDYEKRGEAIPGK